MVPFRKIVKTPMLAVDYVRPYGVLCFKSLWTSIFQAFFSRAIISLIQAHSKNLLVQDLEGHNDPITNCFT